MANTNGMMRPMTALRDFEFNGTPIEAGTVFDSVGLALANQLHAAGHAAHGDLTIHGEWHNLVKNAPENTPQSAVHAKIVSNDNGVIKVQTQEPVISPIHGSATTGSGEEQSAGQVPINPERLLSDEEKADLAKQQEKQAAEGSQIAVGTLDGVIVNPEKGDVKPEDRATTAETGAAGGEGANPPSTDEKDLKSSAREEGAGEKAVDPAKGDKATPDTKDGVIRRTTPTSTAKK